MKKKWFHAMVVFILTFMVMTFLYKVYGYAPFGNRSLASMDANIQYLDFFAYFKDVLAGKNQIAQTFSKSLGGPNIGTYSYYLASPFNLLVFFFEKSDLHSFLDWVVALKVSMASAMFCAFLYQRFRTTWEPPHGRALITLLSLSYGLCQYNLAQSSNIMWLDGVYMLPLILWGVYDVVSRHSGWKLSLFVGMSILFGWYSAGINCLFSGIWFCLELALKLCAQNKSSVLNRLKETGRCLGIYLFFMAAGVLNSAVLFWPTVVAMQNSVKGGLEFFRLADMSWIGQVSSVIQGYTLGATSSYGAVSLFCGSFAMTGCLSCFVSRNIRMKEKIILGVTAGVTVMLFYWNPAYVMFSLLKNAASYWYRYSYIGIFAILFMAAYFYGQYDLKRDASRIWKVGLTLAVFLLLWNYFGKTSDMKRVFYTAALLSFESVCLSLALSGIKGKQKAGTLFLWAVGMTVIGELTWSSKLQMDHYHTSDVAAYQNYVKNTQEQIDFLKDMDSTEMYRISQTSTRNHNRSINQTANYNESMAFGYAGLASYTSSPDDRQMILLDRLGYHWEGECMTIVNTSIIGADSLLGVKYILSEYPINGLTETEGPVESGTKKIYENPYYLPFAFPYDPSAYSAKAYNPFTFQNMLYGQLTGSEAEVYKRLAFSAERDENGVLRYSIQIPPGNYAVYGNMPWYWNIDALINVNNQYEMSYTTWLSPYVFYIPTEMKSEDSTAVITITASGYDGIYPGEEQFYALDLDYLQTVSEILRTKAEHVSRSEITNQKACFEVEASEGEDLYVSIPHDNGWRITRNGEWLKVRLFGGCMYSIPLKEGKNVIEMTYHLPGLWVGILSTCIGVFLTFLGFWIEHRKKTSSR